MLSATEPQGLMTNVERFCQGGCDVCHIFIFFRTVLLDYNSLSAKFDQADSTLKRDYVMPSRESPI